MEETDQIKMPSSGSAVGEQVAGAQAAEAGTTEAEAAEVAAVEGVEEDQAAEAEAAKPAGAEAEAAAARRMMVHFETLDENGEPVRYNLEMRRKYLCSLETLVSAFQRKLPQGVAPTLAQLQAMEMTVQYEHEGVHTRFDPSQPNAMKGMSQNAVELNIADE